VCLDAWSVCSVCGRFLLILIYTHAAFRAPQNSFSRSLLSAHDCCKIGPRVTCFTITETDFGSSRFEDYSTSSSIIVFLNTNSRPSGQVAACPCSDTDFSSAFNTVLAILLTLRNPQCSDKCFHMGFWITCLALFLLASALRSHYRVIIIVGCRTHCSNGAKPRSRYYHLSDLTPPFRNLTFRDESSRLLQVP
jgi:hypothetical protein